MRYIQVEDGLRLRFSGRSEEFDLGVEIGLLVADLASGQVEFTRSVADANVDQARQVARRLGYHVRLLNADEASSEMMFSVRRRAPVLTLVQGDLRSA